MPSIARHVGNVGCPVEDKEWLAVDLYVPRVVEERDKVFEVRDPVFKVVSLPQQHLGPILPVPPLGPVLVGPRDAKRQGGPSFRRPMSGASSGAGLLANQ